MPRHDEENQTRRPARSRRQIPPEENHRRSHRPRLSHRRPRRRRRAEARLRTRKATAHTQRQLHELQVNQVELEIQNEELRSTRALAESLLTRYSELYDFSPLGYFTIGRTGLITQTNLTGSRMLGLPRARLIGQRFDRFVAEADRPVYQAFLQRVFAALTEQVCEVTLPRQTLPPLVVLFEGRLSVDDLECHAVVADITERKRAEDEVRRLNTELEARVRQRTATIRRLAIELTHAEKRERVRLSHVLHENLQQLIVGALFLLQSVDKNLSPADRRQVRRAKKILTESVQVARALAVELSPPILRSDGLAAALRWLARWMKEHHGMTVKVTGHANAAPLTEELSFILFQDVRELLFNVLKHARVKSARVALDALNGQVRIVISDKGAGFDPARFQPDAASTTGKLGLFSVGERLALLDGKMEIASAPGQGCRITLRVPPRPLGLD